MRRPLFGLTLLAAMALAPSLHGQTVKIGWIDSNSVLSQYAGAQEARQQMEQSLASYQAEIEQMNNDFQSAMASFQQQQATMTAEARQNRQEELQSQQRVLQQRVAELEQQASTRQAEVFQPVMTEINAVIETIRVEGNYAMILDVASQAILSADPALDLTQEVLRRLQEAAPDTDGDR